MPPLMEAPPLQRAKLVIPLIPPSVNHYWDIRVFRGKLNIRKSDEAIAFMNAMCLFARGQRVRIDNLPDKKTKSAYAVTVRVYLGKGDRGDIANFEKGVGDGLEKAGVIHTDARINEYHQYKHRDRLRPRTEIEVEAKIEDEDAVRAD